MTKKMSGSSNNHKLNGNLITLATTGKNQVPQQQQQSSIHHSHHQQQHQTLSSSSSSTTSSATSASHHPSTATATVAQQQQLHHHQQQQQQQLHQHQTQTVATVHQQMSGGQHHHHHHQSTSGSNIPTVQHTIPPRYQPPPQPPGGGILKHIPIPTSTIKTTSSHQALSPSSYYPVAPPELNAPHLNIKYPPEIPKLASVYIPDSVKNTGNSTRFTQRPPPTSTHRSSGGHIPVLIQNPSSQHHLPVSEDNLARQQQQQQQQTAAQQQQQQQQEMLKFVRKTDSVDPTGSSSAGGSTASGPTSQGTVNSGQTGSGRLTAEQNRHLQSLLSELRALKEANQRLSEDNQELRDLCCFLDDDRQKGRKLAREWQRFGRYTASVMRQEVSAYQNKLRQLDDKQQELIRDNLELKELCLYLDEERAHVAANTLCANCGAPTRPSLRDDGDGSSSSTNADETISAAIRQYERQIPVELNVRSALSDQTLQYVRSLERRIHQLEEERLSAAGHNGTGGLVVGGVGNVTQTNNSTTQQLPDPMSGRPEAVVRALQVLEVREQLERDRGCGGGLGITQGGNATPTEHMDDGEKALVREMCNVVWRKLEESPNGPNMDPI